MTSARVIATASAAILAGLSLAPGAGAQPRLSDPLQADAGLTFQPLPADAGLAFRPLQADAGLTFQPLARSSARHHLACDARAGRRHHHRRRRRHRGRASVSGCLAAGGQNGGARRGPGGKLRSSSSAQPSIPLVAIPDAAAVEASPSLPAQIGEGPLQAAGKTVDVGSSPGSGDEGSGVGSRKETQPRGASGTGSGMSEPGQSGSGESGSAGTGGQQSGPSEAGTGSGGSRGEAGSGTGGSGSEGGSGSGGEAGSGTGGSGSEAGSGSDGSGSEAGSGSGGSGSEAGSGSGGSGSEAGSGSGGSGSEAGSGSDGSGSEAGSGSGGSGGEAGSGSGGSGGEAGSGASGSGSEAGTGSSGSGGEAGTGSSGSGGEAGSGSGGSGGEVGSGTSGSGSEAGSESGSSGASGESGSSGSPGSETGSGSLGGGVSAEPFRFFSSTSFWNTQPAASAALDPSSATVVAALAEEAAQEVQAKKGPAVNTTSWSVPIYTVPANQPTVKVKLPYASVQPRPALQAAWEAVPLPENAVPAAGTDKHLVVWQPSSDKLWEFWHLEKTSEGWEAYWGGAIENVTHASGAYGPEAWPGAVTSWGASASSLSIAGGLITLEDLEKGTINHALAIAVPNTREDAYASPAQRTDGVSSEADSLPEGAHLRLNPQLDLAALHLPHFTLMLAEAAQKYGIFVRDTAANIAFYAQDPTPTGTNPYTGKSGYYEGKSPTQLLAVFPWGELQLLKMEIHS